VTVGTKNFGLSQSCWSVRAGGGGAKHGVLPLRCMKYLGLHHSSLVLALTPDYLRVHPFLQTTEPDIEQADCRFRSYSDVRTGYSFLWIDMAVLILVLNAASRCPVIKAIFPGHTWRHYEYLQHTLSDLVPSLSVCVKTSMGYKGLSGGWFFENFSNRFREIGCHFDV